MKKLFLNDRFIIWIILLNACLLCIQEAGVHLWWIDALDALCTILFTVEMIVKQSEWGMKAYWSRGWNIMDGTLVILSLPSLVYFVWPGVAFNLSFLLVLRVLRIFRFFRVFHLFPNFEKIIKNVRLAMKQSFSVFVGFGILLVVFSLISCAIFRNAAPDYFGTPWDSLYSVFKMCTVEGWYEIPDAVVVGAPAWSVHLIRIYFVTILISMGLLGMSIINSIFVDAMVSDNNDEVLKKLAEIEKKLEMKNM